jgi:hypothetical protein
MAKKKDDTWPAPPVVRIAPLNELKAYIVSEHELDALARGSTGALFLNFALSLLPIALTLIVTLSTTPIESNRLFQTFVSIATITFIAGMLLLLLWVREHKNARSLVEQIKSRMSPQPAIQVEPLFQDLNASKSLIIDEPESPIKAKPSC